VAELHFDEGTVDARIAECPDRPAVFLIWPREGKPYLGKTSLLRRRLKRLLGPRAHASRFLHLRAVAERINYWLYGSRLEANLRMYGLAREHFPEDYARTIKLRQPSYVKLVLTNEFPRTHVTTRLSGAGSLHFGPFATRASADEFEAGFLDFFQLRRCQEDLVPSPDHPGCVYGEMNKCMRPCQQIVGVEEYASEAQRVSTFLSTSGASLLESLEAARERFSADLEFEEAARTHKRLERVQSVVQTKGDLAGDILKLSGLAIVPSAVPECVGLWPFFNGMWRAGCDFALREEEGSPRPMDRRLREMFEALPPARRVSLTERQDHVAILTSWYFSSWRDGEWVPFSDASNPPYRKLVNAIHRVAKTVTP
jgi:excinuclease ABC subunit C